MHLLKKYEVSLSAIKFNEFFLSAGVLEIKTRKSRSKGINSFKSLTGFSLKFGKNLILPQNQLETSPHYFEDKFSDLLDFLHLIR